MVGAACYLLSALLAAWLPNLGPDLEGIDSALCEGLGNVVGGLRDAARHLPPLGRLAFGVVGAVQILCAAMIVATILLFRNHLERADAGAGLAGFGVAVGASGAGYAVAALVTSSMARRFGMGGYVTSLGVLAATVQVFPATLFTRWAVVVSAFGLGITTRGVKICVDTTLQRVVTDSYRGRVFVLYDVLFNAGFVAATALAAAVLPTDGRSYVVLATASLWYLAQPAIRWCRENPDVRTGRASLEPTYEGSSPDAIPPARSGSDLRGGEADSQGE